VVIVQKDKVFLNQVRKLSLKLLNIKFTLPKANIKKVAGKI